VKDVDFGRGQLVIRDPKWKRDRTTMLPRSVTSDLHEQLLRARLRHEEDLAEGWGRVWLPDALVRKFPKAAADWKWQWVFPATSRWRDREGCEGRHHLHETVVQRAVTRAATEAVVVIPSPRTCSSETTTSARCRTAGTPRRVDDDDLYPRPPARSSRCPQPARLNGVA